MILKCEAVLSASFIHRQTMEKLDIDLNIERTEDTESGHLDWIYENDIDFSREEDPERFDRFVAEHLKEDVKSACMEKVKTITDTFKEFFAEPNIYGWVEFGGYILNPRDFCGVAIKDFKLNIKTESEG